MITDNTSFEFFLEPLAKKLVQRVAGIRVMLDRGPLNEDYEKIEVFFALKCGAWIDENTVSGVCALIALSSEAADAITARCAELQEDGVFALGIFEEASWQFGADEVLELEPMLGGYNDDDLVGKVSVFVCFVSDDDSLVSSRCLSSKSKRHLSLPDFEF